jgi:O-antigen ligase
MHRVGASIFTVLMLSPLFAWHGFGYDHPRLAIVVALATLLVLRAALTSARRREGWPAPGPVLLSGMALLAVQVASLLSSQAPWEGALSVLSLAAGLAIFGYAAGGWLPRRYVFRVAPWAIAVLALSAAGVGMFQKFWVGMPAVSTEGNTNYAGTLAAMLLPPTVAFAFLRAPVANRVLAIWAAASVFVLLLMTDSRGGLVGAFAGCGVVIVALRARRVPFALPAVGVVLVALVAVPAAWRGSHHLSEERSETVDVRLEVWKGSLAMFAERPVLGWGAGNFESAYPPFRTRKEFELSQKPGDIRFRSVEDAHSSVVQTAVETGALGLVAFLAVILLAAVRWTSGLRGAPDADYAVLLAGFGGGAVAFLVSGLFNTLTAHVSHTVLFWAFLALAALVGDAREEPRRGFFGRAAGAIAWLVAIAFVGGTVVAARLSWADYAYNLGMAPGVPLNPWDLMAWRVRQFEKALQYFPQAWRARFELGRTYGLQRRKSEEIAAFLEVLRTHPHHLPTLTGIVGALGEEKRWPEAEGFAQRMIAVAPFYPIGHYQLGAIEMRKQRPAEAERHFTRTVELWPGHSRGWYYLGLSRLSQGNVVRALEGFRGARALQFNVGRELRQDAPHTATDPRFREFYP